MNTCSRRAYYLIVVAMMVIAATSLGWCEYAPTPAVVSTLAFSATLEPSEAHLFADSLLTTRPALPPSETSEPVVLATTPDVGSDQPPSRLIIVNQIEREGDLRDVAVSPSGGYIAVASLRGVHLLRAKDLEGEWTVAKPGGVSAIAFSADGSILGIAGNSVVLMNVADQRELNTLVGLSRGAIAFAPDGETLATGGPEGIFLWKVSTGTQSQILEQNPNHVYGLVFSPDGAILVSASDVLGLSLWDTAHRRKIRDLQGETGWGGPIDVAYSPSGNMLAVTYSEALTALWNTQNWTTFHTIAHFTQAGKVAFAPNEMTFASGGADGTITLWSVATAESVHTLQGEQDWGAVMGIAFFPDGESLVAIYSEGAVALWNVAGDA